MVRNAEIFESISDEEIVDLVKALIRIPSHAEIKGQEKEVGHFIANKFEREGIEVKLQNVEDNRFNVIGIIRGENNGCSLMLNGHLDTVPPSHKMIDPYNPIIKDGKLYGRGAADTKGGIGAMIYSLIAIKRSNIILNGNLIFTGVIGEESPGHGGTGYIVKHGPKADVAIVSEPTNLKIVTAHKGIERIEIDIEGKSAQSSIPQKGVNAISKAAKFINAIEKDLVPKLNRRKHNLLGSPTINIGTIKGGINPNMVPDNCIIKLDRYWIPTESPSIIIKEFEDILNCLKKNDPEFEAELRRMEYLKEMPHGPLEISEDCYIAQVLKKSLCKIGLSPEISTIAAWTDAALLWNQGKISTLLFSPGDIRQAHSDREWVNVNDLITATKVYILTALEVCTHNNCVPSTIVLNQDSSSIGQSQKIRPGKDLTLGGLKG